LLVHITNQIKHHKMTKNNIFLLDGYTSDYTLGALSDDSDDVLTLSQTLYDGGTFDIKNLVSKAFDVKSFETSVVFDIKSTRELKKLSKPNQPYSLKVGSNVRYKNKSYDVIGFYYNQFAQLNIISPILFNPSSLVSDVSNLFYGLKTNDEVKQIINDNLKAGKYSADILFPLTVGVKNYKKELSNILQPPFTSLDSISIKRKEQVKAGQPLIPYQLDLNQLDFDLFKLKLNSSITPEWGAKKDDASYTDIKDFKDLVEKKIDSSKEYGIFNRTYIISHLQVDGKQNALLPYNTINQSDTGTNRFSDLAIEIMYSTPIGKIKPILRFGVHLRNYAENESSAIIGGQYIFGIGHGAFTQINQNQFINSLLFSDPTLKGVFYGLNGSSNDFMNENEFSLLRGAIPYIRESYSAYVFKENTFYGGFFASSGTITKNSETDNEILPFGAVFKKNGIYYYVISYLNDDYCFCVKTSTRSSIIKPTFNPSNKTEIKASFKKFTKKEVFNAFKKEGHIFDIPDSYYSLPQSKPNVDKEKRKDVNSTLVTDVFLDKRKEQFDVLQNNFPELGNTFLGILSVLDKSLSKPKLDKLVFEKGLIYLTLFDELNTQDNIKKYTDDDKDLARRSKMIGEKELSWSYLILEEQKEFSKISKAIVDLAVDTSKIKIGDNPLYIGLKTFEDYQKYALTRLVLNIWDNASLWELNGSMTYNRNIIAYPSHNDINVLSKDVFLGDLPSMFLSGIKSERRSDGVQNFFYVGKQWSSYLGIRLKDLKSIRTRLYRIAQMIFVSNILQLLYKNAYSVLVSRANNSYDEFIENSNLIRQIKQFDLSIPFDEYVDNLTALQFKPIIEVKKDLSDKLSESDSKLAQIFRYNNSMQFNRDKDTFKELILQLDKLYGGIFKLKERIIDNKSTEILNNFPKVKIEEIEEIEEDLFDDTDLFEDAFEELGDEFLENLEELDIDELI
tara:strand:+ start:3678 stop:6551 length:2874 start_codon:yes stop_codon:yes gene_type:complete